MNALLLNRDGFQMPADGWYQIAPLGEFAHAAAGLVQVVDREACEAMAQRFGQEASAPNFAGLLVDFDHFSLDGEKRSEAAGWITALEARGTMSDVGSRMSDVGEGSSRGAEARRVPGDGTTKGAEGAKVANAGAGLWAKIRWSDVGEEAVKGGRYRFLSPVWTRTDCVDLGNGRVRPVRMLNAAVTNDPNLKGMRPLSNSGRNAEVGTRNAELGAATTEASEGTEAGGQIANAEHRTSNAQRPSGEEPRFRWVMGGNEKHCPSCAAMAGQVHTMAEWQAGGVVPGCTKLYCRGKCHCSLVATDDAASGAVKAGPVRKLKNAEVGMRNAEVGARVNAEVGTVLANIGWTDEARAASLAVRRAKAAKRKAGKSEKGSHGDTEGTESDDLGWFEDEGLGGMSDEAKERLTERLRKKLEAREEPLSESEEGFLEELTDSGYAGESDDDPIYNWQQKRGAQEQDVLEATGMAFRDARAKAGDLALKEANGTALSAEERAFVSAYNKIMANAEGGTRNAELANVGWTDQARKAALMVRRQKAGLREKQAGAYAGGSPNFDERTGQYRQPPGWWPPWLPWDPRRPVMPGPPVRPSPPRVPRTPGRGQPVRPHLGVGGGMRR